ncbi:MAG: hypothetical protein A3K46_08525 [Chloroflexi bacterium RBG_13_60_9]|nr:MAG: hypothetical protein A3K46_08525 [Chloroflexi bacterium RBG_13_60_9]
MAQRIALFFSVGITAFVLIIVGAAIGLAGQAQAAAGPTLDPLLLAQLQTREAAYQALIAEANGQTRAMEPTPFPTVTPAPEATATEYPISPELAAYLALSVAPNAYLVRPPEVVIYRGRIAYEVTLNTGRVYVDAVSGAILWNGAAQGGDGGGSGFGDEDDEHDDD